MPTVFREKGYRFFFFSNEHDPIHIHIENGKKYAKIDVERLKVVCFKNMSQKELNSLLKIVRNNQERIVEAWDEYFGRE